MVPGNLQKTLPLPPKPLVSVSIATVAVAGTISPVLDASDDVDDDDGAAAGEDDAGGEGNADDADAHPVSAAARAATDAVPAAARGREKILMPP